MESRYAELTDLLPLARQQLAQAESQREEWARARSAAEGQRTEMTMRLAALRVEIGKAGRRSGSGQ